MAVDLFRTRDHVADFDRYVSEYASRSARSRALHRAQLDVPFGDGPSERLDLFLPSAAASPAPIHLFVHGGYWRMFGKEDFSFVADTVVAAGGVAAVIDYALMPGVRMATIVAQVRRAAAWLVANAASFGGDGTRLTVSGHSAGAHLCCTLLETGSPVAPRGALLVSGIYDLAPLRSSFLQPLIELTDEEVAGFSPVDARYRSGSRIHLLVGERETAPFHTQADAMQAALAAQGVAAKRIDVLDKNHMSIALDLGDRSKHVGKLLTQLIREHLGPRS